MSVHPSRRSGRQSEAEEGRVPGDLLLHPVCLVALMVVLLNDFWLKRHFPGLVTGKASDFAGMIYFPLFVTSVVEGIRWTIKRRAWQLSTNIVALICIVVGSVFALIKLIAAVGEPYLAAVNILLWAPAQLISALCGEAGSTQTSATLIVDPSDLVALCVLAVPVWVSRHVMASGSPTDSTAS